VWWISDTLQSKLLFLDYICNEMKVLGLDFTLDDVFAFITQQSINKAAGLFK
jgi:hypothetical protein